MDAVKKTMELLLLCTVSLMLHAVAIGSATEHEFHKERLALVEAIQNDVRRTSAHLDKESLDERVLDAMRQVPRHLFVPKNSQADAYQNRPLAIGHGQTI